MVDGIFGVIHGSRSEMGGEKYLEAAYKELARKAESTTKLIFW